MMKIQQIDQEEKCQETEDSPLPNPWKSVFLLFILGSCERTVFFWLVILMSFATLYPWLWMVSASLLLLPLKFPNE